MTLSEFITTTFDADNQYQVRPRIFCNDGFSMSVQAGWGKYSIPREHGTVFTFYEIGYPSKKEPLLMPHCRDKRRPKQTVYTYVPFEVVEAVIEKHGGIDERKTMERH